MKKTREETKNLTFSLNVNEDNGWQRDAMMVVLLMDVRDELQRLNGLLHCSNFTGIPGTLRTISRKMPARRKRAR